MCEACPIIDWAENLPTVRSFTAERITDDVDDMIVWYDRYEKEHKALVGGKNASLGEMMRAELPVPPGFAVTTDAYAQIWSNQAMVDEVNQLLQSIDHADYVANIATSEQIRAVIEAEPVPAAVAETIERAYAALCEHCGVENVPVAVRSSATAEDLPDASFAGQQDTFLWIQGGASVVEHVRRCWSSLFTDRAIAYRHQMGYLQKSIAMSVGVQKMVDPKASGVAFTLNPTNGDRSQVAIDASWGLGEAVVSGEVNPDNYLIDKVIQEIVERNISTKLIEYRLTDSGTVDKVPVDAERQDKPCLSDDELKAVALLARKAEKHYGTPQDVEWAIDRHLPEGQNVLMLQSRPETVWSQKPVEPVSPAAHKGAGKSTDYMSSIVNTLISPLHNKSSNSKSSNSTEDKKD